LAFQRKSAMVLLLSHTNSRYSQKVVYIVALANILIFWDFIVSSLALVMVWVLF
jgi:hypothetical protein